MPKNKSTGYSLIRSQKAKFTNGNNTNGVYTCCMDNVIIGNYAYRAKNSNITNTDIGRFCSIGPNFCCGLGIHPTNGISTSPMFYSVAKQNGTTLSVDNKIEE